MKINKRTKTKLAIYIALVLTFNFGFTPVFAAGDPYFGRQQSKRLYLQLDSCYRYDLARIWCRTDWSFIKES